MLGVLARGVLGLFTRTFDFRTGPTGKVMLMPEEKADTDYIMVATGTGIAPYRGFIRRLFVEKTPYGEAYDGGHTCTCTCSTPCWASPYSRLSVVSRLATTLYTTHLGTRVWQVQGPRLALPRRRQQGRAALR